MLPHRVGLNTFTTGECSGWEVLSTSSYSPCTVSLHVNHGKHWAKRKLRSHFLFIALPETDKNRDWSIPIFSWFEQPLGPSHPSNTCLQDAHPNNRNYIFAAAMNPRYGCNHRAQVRPRIRAEGR